MFVKFLLALAVLCVAVSGKAPSSKVRKRLILSCILSYQPCNNIEEKNKNIPCNFFKKFKHDPYCIITFPNMDLCAFFIPLVVNLSNCQRYQRRWHRRA
jgi:hypothetical protein